MNQEKKSLFTWLSLSTVLRYLGTVTLLVSAATFLFQNWDHLRAATRFEAFVGFTVMIAGLGYWLANRFGDRKGGCALLGIAGTFVSLNFCVMGAMILSTWATEGTQHSFPMYLRWTAASSDEALFLTLLGSAISLPILWATFQTLVGKYAPELTLVSLLLNAFLLIPTRTTGMVGVLSLAIFGVTLAYERWILSQRVELQSSPGRFGRGLLYLPYFALVVRNVGLYAVDSFFLGMILAAGATALFTLSPSLSIDLEERKAVQALSLVPAGISWSLIYDTLFRTLGAGPNDQWLLMILPFAIVLFIMSKCAIGNGRNYLTLAFTLATLAFLAHIAEAPGTLSAFYSLVAGTILLMYAFRVRLTWGAVCGTGLFLTGVIYYFVRAIQIAAYGPWVALGVLGLGIIIISSYLERYSGKLREQWTRFRERFVERE